MIEKIIFNLIAFTLFILIFIKLVKENDTNYIYLLGLQFVGIAINFIELIINVKLNIFIRIVIYLLSVILPLIFVLIEYKKNINFTEILGIFLSKINYKLENKDKAYLNVNNILKRYPNSKIAHKILAQMYEQDGKLEFAISEYEQIVDYDSKNYKDYLKLAKLCKDCAKTNEAKEMYADILKNDPANYEASIEISDILFNDGEFKEAIQVCMSALKYNPEDYDLYYNLGMAYTMINDFQKAKTCYEHAAQINSLLYNAKYSLGELALIYGDLETAKNYFVDCLNAEEIESGAYYYLARISIIKGEEQEAIEYGNMAVEEDFKNYDKMYNDNIFVTIREKLKKPEKDIENKNKKAITEKEEKVNKHLEETCKIVGKLNNNDIQMIENVMKTKEQQNIKEQVEKEKEQ